MQGVEDVVVRIHGLDQRLPAASVTTAGGPAGVEPTRPIRPGDFLLGRAHGVRHGLIRFGQRAQLEADDRHLAEYTHAALVTSYEGDLLEAVGTGVRPSTLVEYVVGRESFQIVRIEASEADRDQIVEFAAGVRHARADYGFLTNVSIALWASTGTRLTFFLDGSHTCSGLVAAAIERAGYCFGTNAVRVMPAQLASFFGAPPAPPVPSRRPAPGRGRG